MIVVKKKLAKKLVLIAKSLIASEEPGVPYLFEKLPVSNYVYKVRSGERFVVKTHEGDSIAKPGMYIITSPSQKVGTWCVSEKSFKDNYEKATETNKVDDEFIDSLGGVWEWRKDGYKGDLWQRKSQNIVMFKTEVDIKGIDCGWAILDATAGDWVEIVDGELGAPRNEASANKDFKKLKKVKVALPDDYLKLVDKE